MAESCMGYDSVPLTLQAEISRIQCISKDGIVSFEPWWKVWWFCNTKKYQQQALIIKTMICCRNRYLLLWQAYSMSHVLTNYKLIVPS